MGAPFIDIVTNGASPDEGSPLTKIFAPATPPELSDQTPGTKSKAAAVLVGDNWSICLGDIVVIAKLASFF